MRINLKVLFAEKDTVKALGARWDGTLKVWYVKDVEDLTSFRPWIPGSGGLFADTPPRAAAKANKPSKDEKPDIGGSSITTSATLAHCGCDVLPWLDCIHTVPKP